MSPATPETRLSSLDQIFRESVQRHHRRPALECQGKVFTYGQLEEQVAAWAGVLADLGAGPGRTVALFLPRSHDHILALLAVLRTGAAYVPMDPAIPLDRARTILKDAGVSVTVTTGERWQALGVDGKAALMDQARPAAKSLVASPAGRGDLAYIIYTSGSTGTPKGVPITHGNALTFLEGEADVFEIRPDDRVYQGFSIAFDASVEEIWLALRNGATLVVADEGMATAGSSLPAMLAHARITVLSTVPTVLAMMEETVPGIRLLITGGEACPEALVAKWAPGRRMVNTYGPTETTVVSTWADVVPGEKVTIGEPLPGYLAMVVDEQMAPVADGVDGELLIGGGAVSPGYLGRPDLNEKKFLTRDGVRWYRTGDKVMRQDGNLVFHGRIDDQVKLRGFRIELGEIEAALGDLPAVARAAVTRREDEPGLAYLAAYVVLHPGRPFDEKATREALKGRLPAYMVPSVFTVMEKFPATAGGKVDKNRLPAPDRTRGEAGGKAPATANEKVLHDLWSSYFAPQPVSTTDHFFDLGGHSLLATRLVSDLRAGGAHGDISVMDVYGHPVLSELAARLDELDGENTAKTEHARNRVSPVRHFFCGLGQLAAFYPILLIASASTVLTFFVYQQLFERKQQITITVLIAIALLLSMRPIQMLAAVGLKWVLLGRFRAGSWPVWGFYYFRFWLVRQLLTSFNSRAFLSTPAMSLYYRLLGARIGKGVHLQTEGLLATDLITIGDHTTVGKDAWLPGYVVENGRLIVGPVTIGRGCVVGARSLLAPGSRMGDGSELGDGALLREGMAIPDGEYWKGAPARAAGPARNPDWAREDARPSSHPASLWFGYGLGALCLPLFPMAAALPGALLLRYVEYHWCDFYGQYWDIWKIALTAPAAVGLFVVLLCLEIAAAKWILTGHQSAGVYPLRSLRQVRKWFVDSLLHLSQDLLFPLYSTIYLPPWFRLMGARLGKRVEVSTAEHINPDLLQLGDGSFVADAVFLGAAEVRKGWVRLAPVSVGKNAFLGNNSVVPAGTVMADESLVGVLSMPPEDESQSRMPHASWLGIPGFRLPRRQESTAFGDEVTYHPSRRLVLYRAFIEGIRVILPGSVMVTLIMCLLLAAGHLLDEEILSVWELLLVYPVLSGAVGVLSIAFTIALKWVVMGRYRPREKPLWDPFVWKSELVTATHEHLAVPSMAGMFQGTPFMPWYFRLLGSRFGRRVFLDTFYITEFDLVAVGDEACVNHHVDCQTHLFEDRVMKMDLVRIDAGASVGPSAVVLYGGTVSAGAVVEGRTLIMKGETIPPDTRWTGSPAVRG